jgi:hypothetical protein
MIRAAAYVRISTAGQDEDSGGAGEEAQRQTIERIALEHELEIVEWFWEQASGAFLERPKPVDIYGSSYVSLASRSTTRPASKEKAGPIEWCSP